MNPNLFSKGFVPAVAVSAVTDGSWPGRGVGSVPQVQPWRRLKWGATASTPRRDLAGARRPPRRRVAGGPRSGRASAGSGACAVVARACAWEGRRQAAAVGTTGTTTTVAGVVTTAVVAGRHRL